MNIDLEINDYSIFLGMPLDSSSFADAQIRKIGFFGKEFMPGQKTGDIIYWSKNPTISCFGGRVQEAAMLDRRMGADMIYGTSAYLFFNKNRLRYVIFQVIYSYSAAIRFTNEFREVASELLWEPEKLNYTQIPSMVMGIKGYEPG